MTRITADPKGFPELEPLISLAGGLLAFSRAVGYSHQQVQYWRRRGYIFHPSDREAVARVARELGKDIPASAFDRKERHWAPRKKPKQRKGIRS